MFLAAHVDKVVDDHTTEVAKSQLAGDFLGGGDVHAIGRFFRGVVGTKAAAVDINRDQGFGLVDHDRATLSQRHFAIVNLGDFSVYLIFVKQRFFAVVAIVYVPLVGHPSLPPSNASWSGSLPGPPLLSCPRMLSDAGT